MTDIGQKIIAEVKKIAAENPNFIYEKPDGENCFYIYNKCPSCLIGRALFNLGLIDESLEFLMSEDDEPVNCFIVDDLLKRLGIYVDDDELFWLMNVQGWQDIREPWGKAVQLNGVLL